MSGPVIHGMTRSPEYRAWADLIQRCQNPRNARYPSYGGRGITVCERWQIAANFLADMGSRPSAEHSIDRIDNDDGYEPSNCRWSTRSEQQKNKAGYRTDHRLPRGDNHWTRRDVVRAGENARRNIVRAHASGAENGNAKLTLKTAEAMRAAFAANPKTRMADLGRMFSVGRETARKVVKGVAWR